MATIEILNQKRLHRSITDGSNIKVDLSLSLKNWGKFEGQYKAVYGQVSANQIAEWWEAHGDNLFTRNIRKLLGDTEINKEIKDTLATEPGKFWYFNNGITMVCESYERNASHSINRDFGIFECKGVHIINGAQTVGSIGKFAQFENENDEVNLESVFVHIRIVSLENKEDDEVFVDEKFADRITKTNNRQNKIENRDFISMEPVQKRIEKELKVEGINYHVSRSESEERNESSFDVHESTVALACATDIDSSTTAHRGPDGFWSDVKGSKYKKLFNPSTSSFYVWNCVQINRLIKSEIEAIISESKDEEKAYLHYGDEFISFIIFKLIDPSKIKKDKIGIEGIFDNINLNETIKTIVAIIKEHCRDYRKSIPNIFKNYQDCRDLYQVVMLTISQEEVEKEPETIDSLINRKFQKVSVRNKVITFSNNHSGDPIAEEAFTIWLNNIYNESRHECGIVSNIQHYLEGDTPRKDRFILRIRNGKTLVISFDFNSYGTEYRSLLYGIDGFKEWIDHNTTDGNIRFNDENDLEKLDKLKSFVLQN